MDEAPLPNVERANRALAALWRWGVPRPRLEVEALERAALRGRPPSAFGSDQWWREPLGVLVRALHEEASLNPLGETMAHGQLVMALRARIRAQRLWARHPGILERPIAAPIVVLGQMRSGTTRMQRLLACDERLAHTRLYESLFPVPRPGRRLLAGAGVALFRALNPAIDRIHPSSASAPEEEFGLLSLSFAGDLYQAQWRVPGFARWWEAADPAPLYREFAAMLRTNAWARGDPPDKPPILKVPQFMQDVPALLDALPDARVIRLHRRFDAVVPSSCSLVWNQMRVQSGSADPAWIGREWLRKTKLREARAEAALATRPEVPVIRVDYQAMDRDWRAEIARIYAFLGLELRAELLRRMERYLGSARRHLGHRYSAERFGLDAGELAALSAAPAAE